MTTKKTTPDPTPQATPTPDPAPVEATPAPAPTPAPRRANRRNPLDLAEQAGQMWIINAAGRCVQVSRDMGEAFIKLNKATPAPVARIAEELGIDVAELDRAPDTARARKLDRDRIAMSLGAKRKAELVNLCAAHGIDGTADDNHQQLVATLTDAIMSGQLSESVAV